VEETLRVLVAFGFGLLLVMLRFDAERFGVAEYLDSATGGRLTVARRRFAWYGMGIGLVAAVMVLYPEPDGQLGLQIGDRGQAILAGLGFGAIGIAQAAGVAPARQSSSAARASAAKRAPPPKPRRAAGIPVRSRFRTPAGSERVPFARRTSLRTRMSELRTNLRP